MNTPKTIILRDHSGLKKSSELSILDVNCCSRSSGFVKRISGECYLDVKHVQRYIVGW